MAGVNTMPSLLFCDKPPPAASLLFASSSSVCKAAMRSSKLLIAIWLIK